MAAFHCQDNGTQDRNDRTGFKLGEAGAECIAELTATRGKLSYREVTLESTEALNRFLGNVERQSFIMAQMATRNHDDSLDIVHDAMFGFLKRYTSRPEEEWKPLYYRVLNSRIRDWQRRAVVRGRFRAWLGFAGDEEDEAADPLEKFPDISTPDPAVQIILNDAADAIKTALRSLPLRQREAFLLRAWEGMDVRETAYAMGCSEGSVKTHYSRAVHTLRGLLEEHRP